MRRELDRFSDDAKAVMIGDRDDPQFRLIADVASLSPAAAIVDLSTGPDFAVRLDRLGGVTAEYQGAPLTVSSIWCRLKLPYAAPGRGGPSGYDIVVKTEWLGFEAGLAYLFGDRSLHDAGLTAAESKLAQLQCAGQAGFRIPETVAGLSKAAALRFAERHPQMVLKAMQASRVTHEGVNQVDILITTPLSRTEVDAADEAEFARCPFLLQERLDNSSEHRVIAFGDFIYCYRVMDPAGVEPLVDRRMMRPGYVLAPTPVELPALVRRYLDLMGLTYGVFDLIFDAEVPCFLECNPEGQWHSANGINMREITETFAGWILGGRAARAPLV